MLKSISSVGLCLICTSVRQARENVCRSPWTGPTRGDSDPRTPRGPSGLSALSAPDPDTPNAPE
jgi:hypothetical protein